MKLRVGYVWAEAYAPDPEGEWLRRYLTFDDPRAVHTRAFKMHRWDGKYCLLKHGRFPAGLVPVVCKGAEREGYQVEVEDHRVRPQVPVRAVPPGWLRPYQHDALQACFKGHPKIPGRGIVSMVTGGGKTMVFAALGYAVQCRWLVLVDTKDLMHQAADRYEEWAKEKAGRLGDGIREGGERFVVATMQTLLRAVKRSEAISGFLAGFQGLVIDEVHTSAADGYQKLLESIPNAYYRLGFSGTPLGREDRRDVLTLSHVGPVVYKADPEALAAAGYISRPTITFVPAPQAKPSAGLSWAEVYSDYVVWSDARNARVCEVVDRAARPCLVFVKEIDHGKNLLGLLKGSGKVDFVWGQDDRASRANAIERLERGDLDVLITSKVFNKGVDIPSVRSLVNAAGGRSFFDAIQRLGRGMRATKDKQAFEMWDFDDVGRFLKTHSQRRREAYESAGYKVEVREP